MATIKAPLAPAVVSIPLERKSKKNPKPDTLILTGGGALAFTKSTKREIVAHGAYAVLTGAPADLRAARVYKAWRSVIDGAYSTSKGEVTLLPEPVKTRARNASMVRLARKMGRGIPLARNEMGFWDNEIRRIMNDCLYQANYYPHPSSNLHYVEGGRYKWVPFSIITDGKQGKSEEASVRRDFTPDRKRVEDKGDKYGYRYDWNGETGRFTPHIHAGGRWFSEVYCQGLGVVPCANPAEAYCESAVVLRVITRAVDAPYRMAVMAVRQRTPHPQHAYCDEAPALIGDDGKLHWLPFTPSVTYGQHTVNPVTQAWEHDRYVSHYTNYNQKELIEQAGGVA